MGESNWWNGQIGSDSVNADIRSHYQEVFGKLYRSVYFGFCKASSMDFDGGATQKAPSQGSRSKGAEKCLPRF